MNPQDTPTPSLDSKIRNNLWPTLGGRYTQEQENEAVENLIEVVKLESDKAVEAFAEEIFYGTPEDNPDHILPFTSVEVAERVCSRYEALIERTKQ